MNIEYAVFSSNHWPKRLHSSVCNPEMNEDGMIYYCNRQAVTDVWRDCSIFLPHYATAHFTDRCHSHTYGNSDIHFLRHKKMFPFTINTASPNAAAHSKPCSAQVCWNMVYISVASKTLTSWDIKHSNTMTESWYFHLHTSSLYSW